MDQAIDLDVENLFNEDGALSQSELDQVLPPADSGLLQSQPIPVPISTTAVERILHLAHVGAADKVAWSRQGHITRISDDGSSVHIQCLRILPGTKQWKLSHPKALDTTFENAATMVWSPSGAELAVVDSKGRAYIFSMMATCLNRLSEVKSGRFDAASEQGHPIATYWFSQDRAERPFRNVVLNIIKTADDRWVQTMGKAKSLGQTYPRAFFILHKQGTWSLVYQRPDMQYRRASGKLPVSAGALFSHAAIGPTIEGKMLVALYSTDGTLSVYLAMVTWPSEWRTNNTNPAHPTLNIEVIDVDVSAQLVDPQMTETGIETMVTPENWALSHLRVIPTSDIEAKPRTSPQIWAVFVQTTRSGNAAEAGFVQSSLIRRWHVISATRKLLPSFNEVQNKSDVQNDKPETSIVVERQTNLSLPQPVTGVEYVDNGQCVAIAMGDGHTELWDPVTLTPQSFDGQLNEVTSMAQSGFSFSSMQNTAQTVVSPNTCTTIATQPDNKLALNQALYLGQSKQELGIAGLQQPTAAVSLILAFARSCWSTGTSDDILSCISMACQPSTVTPLIASMYRIIFRPTEFAHEKVPGSELERIVSKPIAGKVFSFHLALLTSTSQTLQVHNGFPPPATWSRLWAWICINLRYTTTSFYLLFRELQSATQNPNVAPPSFPASYTEMICNMVKWTFDLYRFIFEAILEVGDRRSNPDFFKSPSPSNLYNLGDEKGDGSQGLVALLINCHWSRSFLTAAARPMHAFIEKADPSIPLVRHVVEAIRRHSVAKGLSLAAVDKLFDGRWYERAGLVANEVDDTNMLAQRQIEMMASGHVSETYQNTIQNLLDNVLNGETGLRNKSRGGVERLKLFTNTPDISWILLNMDCQVPLPSDNPGQTRSANKLFDVQKKSPIPPFKLSTTTLVNPSANAADDQLKNLSESEEKEKQMIRRCARCGSVSEDPTGTKWEWPKSLMTYMARCVCDGYWVLEEIDRLADDEAEERKKNAKMAAAAAAAAAATMNQDGVMVMDMNHHHHHHSTAADMLAAVNNGENQGGNL